MWTAAVRSGRRFRRDATSSCKSSAEGCSQSVLKGSVAVDGVSLTISAIGNDWIGVDLIPTTAAETILGAKKVGDQVNLEGDIVGKYIAKSAARPGLTEEALARAGFIS